MAYLISSEGLPRYVRQYRHLFTWRRLLNLLQVLASMAVSFVLRRPVVWGRPAMLMVEPTNFCNLKCPLCPSGNGEMKRPRGNMGLDDYRRLIDQVHSHAFLLMLWNQGEPYINRCFNDMVRHAHERRMFTFTSTNGHFVRTSDDARAIVESGLDEIAFSVDGVDQETYARYRVGGDLARVFEGIRLLVRARDDLGSHTPVINLQFIVMRHNQSDVERAERLAADLGVDKFLIKTAQVYSADQAGQYLPVEPAYSRYESDAQAGLRVRGQPARGCKVLWYSSMINWDGRVAPCCFDKDVDFGMGDVFDSRTFTEIWRGAAYRDFRRRVLRDRRSVAMCTNCSEGYRGMFSLVRELRG